MAEIAAYVALGANLDDPAAQVELAFSELARLPGVRLCRRSALYRSQPEGHLEQPDYINAVASVMTTLGPRPLLEALLAIETRHGRSRTFRNAPRTLDLDLLLYDGLVMHEPGLTVPHPRMLERAFVLVPLAEIAGEALIPGHGRVADRVADIDANGLTRLPPAPAQAVR